MQKGGDPSGAGEGTEPDSLTARRTEIFFQRQDTTLCQTGA